MVRFLLVVACVTLAVPAHARTARLLAEDVPAAPPATASASVVPSDGAPSFALQFAVASVAGALAVPLGLVLGLAIANLSISLYPALAIGLVVMGFFAPTVAALAGWIFGNLNLKERPFQFWLGWGAAVLINIGAHVIAGFAGVNLAQALGVVILSVLDGAAMGAASAGLMQLLRPKPSAAVAVIRSTIPGVADTSFLPLSSVAF